MEEDLSDIRIFVDYNAAFPILFARKILVEKVQSFASMDGVYLFIMSRGAIRTEMGGREAKHRVHQASVLHYYREEYLYKGAGIVVAVETEYSACSADEALEEYTVSIAFHTFNERWKLKFKPMLSFRAISQLPCNML